ncbi:hypothetical protein JOE23_001206 [Amphibacillus cookii]|nr:hypothetical protein [Amphibacillus cookii]
MVDRLNDKVIVSIYNKVSDYKVRDFDCDQVDLT